MRQPCPRSHTRTRANAYTHTYLHLRLLPLSVDVAPRAAGRLRAVASHPAQLDPIKLAAMGVRRPTLKRRLTLVSGPLHDPCIPPDAA